MNSIYEDENVCLLSITHPACAHVPACNTDVARTFEQHRTTDLLDDYALVESHDWLSAPGGFR